MRLANHVFPGSGFIVMVRAGDSANGRVICGRHLNL